MAWYANNSGRSYIDAVAILRTDSSNYYKRITENGDQTHAVGQKQPNGWGLYDMHGNVWEWCMDWWRDNYNGAPADGSARLSGGEQEYRVVRGGSWSNLAGDLRSANRFWVALGNRNNYFGLRVLALARG